MARRERQHIPQTVDELTAEWFSDVLAERGVVTHVSIETIGTGVGFMGEVHRCHLTWADPTDSTSTDPVDLAESTGSRPESVIVKVPTQHPANFALGDGLQLYEREIMVYRTLRQSLGIPMPGYVHSAMDPDPVPWLATVILFLFDRLPLRAVNWLLRQLLKLAARSKRRYLLMIEDIADARPPEQMTGGSFDDAAAALRVLARFHAANWMRTDAVESVRRIWPINRGARGYQASYLRNRDRFVERFGAVIGDATVARLDAIQAKVPELHERLAAEPWTLLHGDFRLDNVLFRSDGDVVVLDYQGISSGRPGLDVAYFITTALTIGHRAEEQDLLRCYHDELCSAGVTSYSWEELGTDCRMAKEVLAHRIVGAADVLDTGIDDSKGAGGGVKVDGGRGDESFLDVIQLRVLDWLD